MIETRESSLSMERMQDYWRSLLSMKPTGNAMVDAGFHEEMRCALRDALHVIQDLSHDHSNHKGIAKNQSGKINGSATEIGEWLEA